jgi:Paf1
LSGLQKASKSARPETEKDRQRKEYRQEILRKHGAAGTTGSAPHSSKKQKVAVAPVTPASTTSAFQELFAQRARGFQIDFRFRNAPPRPPVGPCFVGNSLDTVLLEQSRQYKPHNAVEGNHTWKLHVEADIGVPLAPTAINERSYKRTAVDENSHPKLHPDDDALLNWTGSMGDTAAENFKRHQEQTRAAARLSVSQQHLPTSTMNSGPSLQDKKKVFSRVLKEDMQTWMKKTTYLSNDYTRKVHDFKSLAQVKSDLASDLQTKQIEMAQQRSVKAITESFEVKKIEHPTNKQLKIVREYEVLPDVTNWGRAFTHVVIDKIPTTLPSGYDAEDFNHALITNVEQSAKSSARTMTCNVIVPSKNATQSINEYCPIQSYDLDVLPLKEVDAPHMNFSLWLDKLSNVAYYIPIASRVQLSMGRPCPSAFLQPVERRKLTEKESTDIEERIAEVDQDMAEKHHITITSKYPTTGQSAMQETSNSRDASGKGDGTNNSGDINDDDSDADGREVFGSGAYSIVAES